MEIVEEVEKQDEEVLEEVCETANEGVEGDIEMAASVQRIVSTHRTRWDKSKRPPSATRTLLFSCDHEDFENSRWSLQAQGYKKNRGATGDLTGPKQRASPLTVELQGAG